jgi:hypothetical protein
VDGKAVDAAVRRLVRPALREHGFTRFSGRSAWRSDQETVELVVFRSFSSYIATGVGCTTFSFGVEGGVAYRRVLPGVERPKEYDLTFRFSLGKYLRQPFFRPYGRPQPTDRPDVWFVLPDGSNLDDTVADALRAIEEQALPLLDTFREPRLALEMMRQREPSNPDFGTAGVWGYGAVGSPHWQQVAKELADLAGIRDSDS